MDDPLPPDGERGKRLRELRTDAHVTQRAVATATGLSDAGIRKWERGGTMRLAMAGHLAEYYGTTPAWIVSGMGPRRVEPEAAEQNGQVLERLDALQAAVIERIEELDGLLGGRLDGQRDQLTDLTNRVRSLESRGVREPVKRPAEQ